VTTRRRPIFGWIAFSLLLIALLVAAGSVVWGYLQTQDAFEQGPPWFLTTASMSALAVGGISFLALVMGIVGAARREKPGWPAITAMILSLPGLGWMALGVFVMTTVTFQCAGPAGACR
jgi:hypothetical protein